MKHSTACCKTGLVAIYRFDGEMGIGWMGWIGWIGWDGAKRKLARFLGNIGEWLANSLRLGLMWEKNEKKQYPNVSH